MDIQLLKKQIETQGEFLNHEHLERRAEIDQLRIELNTLKRLFEQIHPGFHKKYEEMYRQQKQEWNPELEKAVLKEHKG
ncbi:hypothetical protein WDW37_00735 [Bdellovibrionota bacterium FG-1]